MGYLQLANLARTANARVNTARDLDARWKALGPDGQEAARTEWDNLKAALGAVRTRLEAGPRGFMREFNAARKGEEPEAVPDPRPLGELVRDLHVATEALRAKLDATEAAVPAGAEDEAELSTLSVEPEPPAAPGESPAETPDPEVPPAAPRNGTPPVTDS
ncbi:hypothetical protein DSM112329_01349 [Paraconexibacter sp. AEG42_29]|uniref:Uncharacterized protein n=1 Tax=Paraconexibacter sp. AEG42_29 TaxID=2997339 RepID=A0AAU7AS47_9ACTN